MFLARQRERESSDWSVQLLYLPTRTPVTVVPSNPPGSITILTKPLSLQIKNGGPILKVSSLNVRPGHYTKTAS